MLLLDELDFFSMEGCFQRKAEAMRIGMDEIAMMVMFLNKGIGQERERLHRPES